MTETEEKKPPRGWVRKTGTRLGVGILLLFGTIAILFSAMVGTRMSAPDWVRDRLTTEINERIDGFSVHFGDVAMVLEQEIVPRLWLRDVMLRDETGLPIATLSDIQSQVALKPLLRGELQPRYIKLSGARLSLRRDDDGAVGLSIGQAETQVDEAASLPELVEELEAVLLQPAFADLTLVDAENLSVRYDDLRAGRSWSVDGGRLSLTRAGDDVRLRGDFVLLGARDFATTLEMNYSSRIGEKSGEVGLSFQDMPARDIAGQSPALSWLGALEAPISGALRTSVDENGALGLLNATLQIGAGVVKPNEATKPISFDAVRSYFTYDPEAQVISFSELSVDSKWIKAQAEGRANLLGLERGLPREIVLQVGLDNIEANPAELYPEAITLGPARMDMRLQLDPFVATLGELSLSDQDLSLVLSGEAAAETEGWNVALDGRVDEIGFQRLMELWPTAALKNARVWISENVRAGTVKNVQLAMRSLPEHKPNVFLGFDFEGLDTQYVNGVSIIEGASGHATLNENRFVLTAHSGSITPAQGGRIDITGTSFDIPDVDEKRTPAQVHLRTQSAITAALSLLNEKPFEFLTKAGRPVTLADGRVDLAGMLNFRMVPKLQTKDVAFDVSGTLRDVRSEKIVPNRVLSASALDLKVTDQLLQISGPGLIGQVPFQADFEALLAQEHNGKAKVRGTVELSERFTDEFRIQLPPESLSGSGVAQVELDFEKDDPGTFRLQSDLAGIGLSLPQIDWGLSRGGTGDLTLEGRLGEPPEIDLLALSGAGLEARGNVSLLPSGQLSRASFTRVRVGSWIDAPVELIGRGGNAPPAVRVLGGEIDLRETSLNAGGEAGAAARRGRTGPVSLVLDRLQISEGIALTDFRSELNMNNGPDGQFTGRVNGVTPIQGRVIPQRGRSAFRIQSSDAAGVFASAGLIKQARNGVLDLTLVPGKASGTYEGRLQVTDGMRIKDAPAMAALLNAISLVGILEQMGGDGIHFQEVDARFQLSPERITLYSGSAIGASMGISMDGYYFPADKRLDMQGVISPVYLVNAVGGLFTRRGEGLLGFNYTLKGTTDRLRVSVNPLSVFTPAMFRDIFRRAPPSRPSPGAAQEGATEQAGQTQAPQAEPKDRPKPLGQDDAGGR